REIPGRLLDDLADADETTVGRLHPGTAVRRGVVDLHQRDDTALDALCLRDHRFEQQDPLVDEIVAEEHDERLVADVLARHPDRVAETQRLALTDEVDGGEVGERLDLFQRFRLATFFELELELDVAIEVVFEASLAPAADHEDVVDAGAHCLLDYVLDGRLVHHRQHLLRLRLRRRKEPRAEPRSRDHRLANFHSCQVATTLPLSLYGSTGARYPWHSTVASASRTGVPDAHVRI